MSMQLSHLTYMQFYFSNVCCHVGIIFRRSNRERLEYANETMTEILDSADNPLTVIFAGPS